MALAIGEFNVLNLIKYHKNDIEYILLRNKENLKNYKDYKGHIYINKDKLDKLVNKKSITALASFKEYKMSLNKNKQHILISDYNDEGEIGTIIRTMVAFDFFNLVLVNCPINIFSLKLIRSSVGTFFMCNIKQYKSLKDYKKEFPDSKPIIFKNTKYLSLDIGKELYKIRN